MTEPLFALKAGEATMIETPEGFYVMALAEITAADPAADPLGTAQIRTALAQAIGQDIEITFAATLRERAKPQVNRRVLDGLAQP